MPQRESKSESMIGTMDDWIEIYRKANIAHPYVIHKTEQEEFRNFIEYFKQFYTKSRKCSEGKTIKFQGTQ